MDMDKVKDFFRFRTLWCLKLIKVVYLISFVILTIYLLVDLRNIDGIGRFLFWLVTFVGAHIGLRISFEMFLVMFNIHDFVRSIDDKIGLTNR